jgi:hypothetical protein
MMTHFLAVVLATGFSGDSSAISSGEQSVEDAARAYRIQVYQTFHLDREEFDRRRAEWHRLEQAWIAAGKPDSNTPLLVDWLEEAKEQSAPDAIGPLPELPKITAATKAEKSEWGIWRMFAPSAANGDSKTPEASAKAAATERRGSPKVTDELSPTDAGDGGSAKATTVSSHRKLDDPAVGEKTPDETAPASAAAVTPNHSASNAAISSSARANAPAAVWYHRFERWLGEEIDAIAAPASQESD